MHSSEKLTIFTELLTKDNVMIITHRNPDGDTLGSAFALCKVFLSAGKRAFVACSDQIPKRLRFISDGVADLTVQFEPDCIISIDTATQELIGEVLSPYADKVDYCIDHHHTNTFYAEKSIVSSKSSSAGELLFDLLKLTKTEIDGYIASKIYAAISFDTGCFRYANVTAHTHHVAGKLLKYDIDFEKINRMLFDIASLAQLKIETAVISAVESYKDNTITVLTLTQDMLRKIGSDDVDVEGLSAITRRIEGTIIGISLRETKEGPIKVSLRSLDDRIDVSVIAAQFGGGGHKRASGCSFNTPIKEAKKQLLEAAFQVWDKAFSEKG